MIWSEAEYTISSLHATGTFWQCQQNTYTNGVANTGANNSSFEGIYGEWIQIHFQVESFVLKELKVGARGGHGGPDEGYVFGRVFFPTVCLALFTSIGCPSSACIPWCPPLRLLS